MSKSKSKSKKKIVLKSSNDMIFEVEEAVALQSQTIAQIVEDGLVGSNGVPISNVTGEILSLVIEYCKKHVAVVDGGDGSSSSSHEDLVKWDDEFMNDLDTSTLVSLANAANFLNVQSLLALTCQTIADTMLKGKTAEEIRKVFNIKNDFTPEEKAQLRKANQWAFE